MLFKGTIRWKMKSKIADILKKALTGQQFHVEIAYDGLIAKKILEKYFFRLIIPDAVKPPAGFRF